MAERDIYIQDVATRFNVDKESVQSDVERLVKKNYASYKKDEAQKIKERTAGFQDRINPDFVKSPAIAKNEENVLGLLLLYPEHRKKAFEDSFVTSEDFATEFNLRVFNYLKENYSQNSINFDLDESFSPEEVGRITRMKLNRMNLTENGPSVLSEAVTALRGAIAKKSAEKISSVDELEKLINGMRKNNE